MDEHAAASAFQRAMETHKPEFEQFFFARFLGLTFDYADGQCIITFELKDFMFNPQGSLHGGIIAMVLDISMGHLLNHTQRPGTTLEMKTQYIKAARRGKIRCCGEFIRHGGTISFLKSTMTDEEGATIAFATATWVQLKRPPEGAVSS